MTPTDDEVVARLRASLKATADRTLISAGPFPGITVAPGESHRRPVVTVVSAAAAVAAIAGVTAAVAGTHATRQTRTVHPAAAGVPSPTGPVGTANAIASYVPDPCNPENFYVVASSAQVQGLTYVLDAVPAGYQLYGAWGTIARNDCAGSQTWYVEYDSTANSDANISITVRPAPQHEQFPDGTDVVVQGHAARLVGGGGAKATVLWQTGNVDITISGPLADGTASSLVAVANHLIAVESNDARVVAPANCQVPPGSTCPSASAAPPPTVSPSPDLTADPFIGPVPTPTTTAP